MLNVARFALQEFEAHRWGFVPGRLWVSRQSQQCVTSVFVRDEDHTEEVLRVFAVLRALRPEQVW